MFRCATSSTDREEHLVGTASTVRAFLLIEAPGPWGVDALNDCRLPEDTKQKLARATRDARVRPLLIRKHGRSGSEHLRVFAGYADPRQPWLETTTLDSPDQLMELDLDSLGEGRSPGLDRHDDALFLVCTHGKHDACCAERGRPVAAALSGRYPDQTWEVSHIGGDRFAGNVLVLPQGLYYGRVDGENARRIASGHLAGRLDLDRLRGRCGYGFAVQAAEIFLCRELRRTDLEALRLTRADRTDQETTAEFTCDDQAWRVRVGTSVGEPRRLTCHALGENQPPVHTLVSITRLS